VRLVSKDFMLINGKLYYWKSLTSEIAERTRPVQQQPVTLRNSYGENRNQVINANLPTKINLVNK